MSKEDAALLVTLSKALVREEPQPPRYRREEIAGAGSGAAPGLGISSAQGAADNRKGTGKDGNPIEERTTGISRTAGNSRGGEEGAMTSFRKLE